MSDGIDPPCKERPPNHRELSLASRVFWSALYGGIAGTVGASVLYHPRPGHISFLGATAIFAILGCYPGLMFAIPSALTAWRIEIATGCSVHSTTGVAMRMATFALSAVFAGACSAFAFVALRQ